jgi:phosphoribosyl 1,2-cyclic phosphodiesterase
MRFCVLGSGSRGNAMLVQEQDTCLMVDCGFSARETEFRLARVGVQPGELTGILITHEHADHINGVGAFARKYNVPVWMTHGTAATQRVGELPTLNLLSSHQDFEVRDIQIHPFPVPHDAREPCQFVFSNGAHRLAVLTDLGATTPHIEQQLSACDALLLECNHDTEKLANGSYPISLKQRVGGNYGHLSNNQSAAFLNKIDCSSLQHIVAAHLSEKHNSPELVRDVLSDVLDCETDWIGVACQTEGLAWRDLS